MTMQLLQRRRRRQPTGRRQFEVQYRITYWIVVVGIAITATDRTFCHVQSLSGLRTTNRISRCDNYNIIDRIRTTHVFNGHNIVIPKTTITATIGASLDGYSTRRRRALLFATSKTLLSSSSSNDNESSRNKNNDQTKKKKQKRNLSGGGGFGSTKSTTTRTTTTIKSRNGEASNNYDKQSQTKSLSESSFQQQEPVLDKWGLPPPTLDDIFPPMPSGTVLIPVNYSSSGSELQHQSLDDILDAFQNDYYCLSSFHLKQIFNNDCIERKHMNTYEVQQRQTDNNDNMDPMKIRLVHHTPAVVTIDNFLTPEECNMIEKIAFGPTSTINKNNDDDRQTQSAAVQVNSATFSESSFSKRTSTSWFCTYQSVASTLLAKTVAILNGTVEQMEEPQIVQYRAGQEFSWHYDEIPAQQLSNGGHRIATLIVYLNTVPPDGGGGTIFRDLFMDGTNNYNQRQLCVQPKQGAALLFFPSIRSNTASTNSSDGNKKYEPDDRTLHKGEILKDGYEKRIIQMWIHESKYNAILPSIYNKQTDAIPIINQKLMQLGYPTI